MVSAVSVWQCCYQCCILLWSRDWGVSITQHQSLLSLSLITPLEHSTHLWSLQAQLNPPNSLCSLTTEILEICQYQKKRYSLIVHDPLLLSYCCIMVTVVSSCSGLQCPLQCPPLNMQMMSDNPGHSATQQGYCRQDSSLAHSAGKNNLLLSLSALVCADPSHYFAGKYL